ncbi:ABC transporter ATP-binding protein [Garciella nitratireducens]|uniref:ABC transporter ATP-binding protein n=1 Tax=Garciella nitratireducens TaxID=218205 RepID=UPI001BD61F98|nr:ABC transporter ATP-binding protein [Garciella nitratireducens]
MNNILELSGVNKKFDSFSLNNISFALPKGFIMGFIGHNGAGKTTTIKLILDMLKRDSGLINIFGKDNLKYKNEVMERIGVVMDSTFYVEEWNLADLESSISPFYKNWNTNKYNDLLNDFYLDRNKKIKELSRGMKVKLMIAVALSHGADLLILDEPTSGLDAVSRNELMDILSDFITDENKGILFSTHITADLERVADFITFINNGNIIYSGSKDILLEKYVIVKGGRGALDSNQRELIIGYREHSVGFDGLVERSLLNTLPESVIYEPCNLDDILVRTNMGGKSHE